MESLITVTVIGTILFFLTLSILYFWSIIWSFKDANRRGKSGFAVAALVALFAWPIGLLFWHIIRPENIKLEVKPTQVKKSIFTSNKVMSEYKKMPFLLKILLIISIGASISALLNLIKMKPVQFEYFGSGFPKNVPVVWYLYYLLFNIATILVYFKRSFSLLKKYLYFSIGVLFISALNSVYFVINLPQAQKMPTTFVYLFTYIFGGLIFWYLYKQRQYFNKA